MAFSFNVYSGLLLPFFVQGVVVSAILLARREREEVAADGWLALLLALQTLRLAQWMLGFAGWYDAHTAATTFMFYFPFSNWLAIGPVLYFYFRSLTNQEFRFTRRMLWHFVPALVYVGWHIALVVVDVVGLHWLMGQPLPGHYGTKGVVAVWADRVGFLSWIDALGYVSVAVYAWRALREFRAYAQYLNNNFSDTERIRFSWLRHVLVAVLVSTAVTLGFGITNLLVTPLSYYQAWYDYLFTGFLIYYLSIAGLLTHHRLLALRFSPNLAAPTHTASSASGDTSTLPTLPDTFVEPHQTATASGVLTAPAVATEAQDVSSDIKRWTIRLAKHMELERPYLAPELTLGELATQLQTNTSWLSKVINSGFGQNYNDYINEYRVREAERRLRDPQFRHYTLLAVALESGFNSKSTFNRVFKKLRGATPSEVARQG
ncbi:helix-turn-helix domain-containing protein [Hymenobacter tenuis]